MAKERFRVLAGTVHGCKEGEEFEADLEAEGLNRQALIEGGFVEPVGKGKSEEKEA